MGTSLVLNRRPKVPAEDTAAFGAIAERFRRGGALEQAVSLCRDGLKKFPDHVSARVTLGWALLDLGKYEEARAELEQVMRRAPDNLAAIRGMAELHDRFEHTLNLPMDGPGEWPPPAASVDAADAVPESDDAVIASAPTMVPADMGLPLWSPSPAASEIVEAVANTQIQIETPASGASSVPEVDAFAGAPLLSYAVAAPVDDAPLSLTAPHAEAVSEIASLQNDVEELHVTGESLAALIAEVESLDVVAAPDIADVPAADFVEADSPVVALAAVETIQLESAQVVEFGAVGDEPIELSAAESPEFGRADPLELEASGIDFEVEAVAFEPTAVSESDAVDIQAGPETAAIERAEAFAELAASADAVAEPEVIAEAEVLAEAAVVAEPEVIAEAEVLAEAAVVTEPEAIAEAEVLAEAAVVAEPEAIAEAEVLTEAAVVAEPEVIAEAEVVADAAVVAGAEAIAEVETVAEGAAIAEPEVMTEVEVFAAAEIVAEAEVAVADEPPVVGLAEPESEATTVSKPEEVPEFAAAAMVETPAPVAGVFAFVAAEAEAEEIAAEPMAVAVSQSRKKGEAGIIALEQMLRRVRSRRHELMAESVA